MVIDWLPAGKTWYNLWLRIIIDESRGYVAITGDAGDEALCWYNTVHADDLASYLLNTYYSSKKIQASRHLYTYDQRDIDADIQKFLRDNEMPEDSEEFDELSSLIVSKYVPQEAANILSDISSNWWEHEFGKRFSPHFYYRHVGASMAIREVLEKLDGEEDNDEEFN